MPHRARICGLPRLAHTLVDNPEWSRARAHSMTSEPTIRPVVACKRPLGEVGVGWVEVTLGMGLAGELNVFELAFHGLPHRT